MTKISSAIFFIFLIPYVCFADIDITGKIATSDDIAAAAEIGDKYISKSIIFAEEFSWNDLDWKLDKKIRIKINNNEFLLTVYNDGQDAPAILIFKNIKNVFKIIGGYCFIFGGNGASVNFKDIDINEKRILLDVEFYCLFSGMAPEIIDENDKIELDASKKETNINEKLILRLK